uniref:Periplasmic chaperone PpiD n=1 Tax=candidate division WOR-3 bacterium TaxID=2052148 RepID=A0A7V3ZZ35_UNCW3
MFMQKLRSSTKTILWIVVIAFIAWLFFELGASLTGFRGRQKPWHKGVMAEIDGIKINYTDFERMVSFAVQETLRARPNKNLTPDELKNIRDFNFYDVVRRIKLSRFDEKYRKMIFSNDIYTQILVMNPPAEILSDSNFYTDGKFDQNKYVEVLKDPRNRDYVVNQLMKIRIDLVQELTNQDIALSFNIPQAEKEAIYRLENTKFKIKYLGVKAYQIPDTLIPVELKDLQEYYKKNKEKFKRPPRAAMKLVTFSVVPTSEDTALALERINTALELYKQGETFENLIRDFSDDHGDFGWIRRNDAKFDTIYQSLSVLKVNDVAGPFKFREGFYLFKVVEKEKDSIRVKDIYVEIRPSENTYQEAYRKAEEFKELAKKKGFDKAAKELNLEVFDTQEFNIDGYFIPYVGFRNETVKRFVKESRKKSISDVIKDENTYKVFYLYKKDKGIIPDFEDNEVRARIKGMYISDKKMELISAELQKAMNLIKSGVELDSIPGKLTIPCVVESTSYFTAKTIPSSFVGRDIRFSGFIYSLKKTGELYGPFISKPYGGYIVKLLERVEPTDEEIKNNSKFSVGSYSRIWDFTFREFQQKFVEIQDIKDYRSYFYLY